MACAAEGVLTGTVRNAADGRPVYGALVLADANANWNQPAFSASSDRDGVYRLSELPAGAYAVRFTHAFRVPRDTNAVVVAGQDTVLDCALASATVLQGSVADATDALPVEGAVVLAVPQGGPPGSNGWLMARTDSFGRYQMAPVPDGTYFVSATHPAYLASATQQVALVQGWPPASFSLARRSDHAQRTDVHVQLLCAISGMQIPAAPVRLRVYEDDAGTTLLHDEVQFTKSRGNVVFRGVRKGFFRVSANRAQDGVPVSWWHEHAPADLHLLDGSKQVTFRLEPFKREVKVRLTTEAAWMDAQPYRSMYCQNFWVELKGQAGGGQTYPPRTALTDYDGRVTFKEIPSVPFRLTLRRPGFNPRELDVTPDATGHFPALLDVARPDIRQGAGLQLTLDVPGFVSFDNNTLPGEPEEALGGITLQGLKNSNTEGFFKLFPFQNLTAPLRVNLREIVGTAWPGTYTLSGSGAFGAPRVGSDGRSYGAWIRYSIPPTTITILDQSNVVTEVSLPLQITKPQIAGRLLAADTAVGEDVDLIYRPVTNKTVQFLVHEEMASWFAPEDRAVEVKTDENGEFRAELWPAYYGIWLPDRTNETSLAGYWGERMIVNGSATGWPYPQRYPATWSGPSPTFDYVHFGYSFDTSRLNTIELLTRRRDQFHVRGFVRHEAQGGALRERAVFVNTNDTVFAAPTDELLESGTAARLQVEGATVRSNRLHVYDAKLSYLFTNLGAGVFSVVVPHARYAQTNEITFTNFLWGAPGHLPASRPPSYDELLNQHVLLPMQMNTFLTNRGKLVQVVESAPTETNVLVTIKWLDDQAIEHSYQVTPLFVRCTEYGSRLFKYGSFVFPGSMSVIVLHNQNNKHAYYETTAREVTAYLETPIALDTGPYTLEVNARQEAMRELDVAGLSFKLQGDGTVYATPHVFANHRGAALLQGPGTNSNWSWKHVDYELASMTNGVPRVVATIYANLIFDLRGQVVNALNLAPVPQASLGLLRSDGGRLGTFSVSSYPSNGWFWLSSVQEGFRDYFLDVTCPGYLPTRIRFSPGAPPAYTGSRPVLFVPEPIALTPLQSTLTNITLDRCGYVLGGVKAVGRGGDASALNLTWSAGATPYSGSYSLPDFDNPDGTPNPPRVFPFRDRVTEVWLLNARVNLFTQDDMTVSDREGAAMLPYVPGLPASDQFPSNKRRLPDPDNPAAVLAWLRDVGRGDGYFSTGASRDLSPQTVFFQKLPVAGAPGVSCVATGRLNVANLPPGEFLPILALVTESGAARYQVHSFTDSGQPPLNVIRIPTWLAFATDLMTMAGDAAATYKELKESYAASVPDGKLSALPDYSATIRQSSGYLVYSYRLGVKWLEGSESPGGDLLGLGPGVLGLEFTSDAGIAFEGFTPSIALDLGGELSISDIDLQDLAPNITAIPKLEGQITRVAGLARTIRRTALSSNDWADFSMLTRVGAEMEGYLRYNLAGLTSKIPYVGPALYLADEAGVLQFFARADAAARVDSIDAWRTKEPDRTGPAYLSGGYLMLPPPPPVMLPPEFARDDLELTFLRHEFGGLREVENFKTNFVALGFNFGASLEAEALGGRLYGQAGLRLTGNETNDLVLGKPSLRVIPNQYGDWPVIRRVTGQAEMHLTARADLTVVEIGKTWTWPLVHIDHQFGTTSTLHVADLRTLVWRRGTGNYPPVQLVDDGPVLLRSCLPMQRYCATGNGLAFLSYDSGRGLMTLMVSFHDGAQWSPPVEIAAAAQILEVEMAQLPAPDHRWLVAWGEVGLEDLEFGSQRHTLKSCLFEQGQWSAPALVTQLEGQLRDLHLAVGPVASALYLENANGTGLAQSRVCATTLGTNGWSAPYVVRAPAVLPAAAVAGTGTTNPVPVRVAVVDAAGSLDSQFWNAVTSVVTNGADSQAIHPGPAQAALALCADGTNFYAAWLDAGANLRLHRWTPAQVTPSDPNYDWNDPQLNPWTDLGVVAAGVMARELKAAWLEDAGSDRLVLAWSDGAALHYAFVNPSTMTVTGPAELTRNREGRYHDLRLVPLTNASARLLARFSGLAEEVRQFTLQATSGVVGNDRDGDGMDDLRELEIVDASTNDTRVTIHDVLPGDDCDQDGFSNGTEIAAGSNPADARSVPPQDGVHVAAVLPRAFERDAAPGSFLISRAASDPATNVLQVRVQVTGAAAPGADYAALATRIEIPAHEQAVEVNIVPVADGLAEGDETVTLQLLADPSYTLGRPATATVTIADDPYDAWRRLRFTTAQLADPAISGDDADPDGDGQSNILEFGLDLNPWVSDPSPLRLAVEHDDGNLNCYLGFDRNFDALGDVFLIESATNLLSPEWVDITASLRVLAREPGPQGESVVLLETQSLTNAPQRFYRLNFQPTSVGTLLPLLTVSRNHNAVTVSWPRLADGWVLEWTNALPSVAAPWPQIPPPYQTNGACYEFTEPLHTGTRFYRLHKP